MKGYKAFDEDLKCRGFQYEVGKTYEFDGEPIPCKQGFHFCKSIAECYGFYQMNEYTRICEVDAIGEIKTDDDKKYCTNKIIIVGEVNTLWEKRGNSNASSEAGFCNTGSWNTGDWNTGDWNTGDCNTGNCNTGNCNTGDWNTGSWNTGNRNTGDWNTGNCNTGNCNTGDCNTGNCNTGDWNTGNRNTGDWNTGDWNTGIFCTEERNIFAFDMETELKLEDWLNSDARKLLNHIPKNVVEWINEREMSEEEKKQHPTYKTTGGYLKVLDKSESAQIWWDGLSDTEKEIIYSIPNFDEKKFKKCVGIMG